jgi:2-haloacid dehalogenase
MSAEHVDTEGHSISRRSILGFTAAAAALPISMRIGSAHAAAGAPTALRGIKAMTFDIQGSLVDSGREDWSFGSPSDGMGDCRGIQSCPG